MKPSGLAYALRWLVRDTFSQSLASSAFWLMLSVSVLSILFCLSVRIEQTGPLYQPDDIEISPDRGYLTFGFGAVQVQLFRDDVAAVHFLQVILAQWVAGTFGLLLTLIWTAGFLPAFLEPSAATVLLAKPIPRWLLLLGRVLGVLAFVAFQAAIFVGGTWVALGIRTGVWTPNYLLTFPVLLLHFLMVYSMSVLLAVWTRSTVVCVFGSIIFWLVCYAINYGRYAVLSAEPLGTPAAYGLVELGYWCLPKPADLILLLHQAIDAGKHFPLPDALGAEQTLAIFSPWLSVATSLLSALAIFLVAAWEFRATDY